MKNEIEVFEGNIKTTDSKFKVSDTGKRLIEGYFTTIDVDRGNDVSLPTAFEKTMQQFMEAGGVICFMHDWNKPIGNVIDYRIDSKGVWIKGEIARGVDYIDNVWKLIQQGVVKCFSYGYRTIDSGIRKIGEKIIQELKEVDLLEITIATVPMNNKATFVVAGEVKTVIPHDGTSMEAFVKSLIEHQTKVVPDQYIDIKSLESSIKALRASVYGEEGEIALQIRAIASDLQTAIKEIEKISK